MEKEMNQNDKHYRYRDYSQSLSNDANANSEGLVVSNVSPAFIRVQRLPVKLNAILSNPELSNIIVWIPHGRSWMILKPNDFVSKVMPDYFESANYKSFLRLINAWGFRKMTSGPDKDSYFHEVSE